MNLRLTQINQTDTIRLRTWKDGLLDIIMKADGVELPEDLRQAVLRKIGRLRQYAPQAVRARVHFLMEPLRSPALRFEVTVLFELPGNDVVAAHRGSTAMEALDLVVEKVERRLRKRKTAELARRLPRRSRQGGRIVAGSAVGI